MHVCTYIYTYVHMYVIYTRMYVQLGDHVGASWCPPNDTPYYLRRPSANVITQRAQLGDDIGTIYYRLNAHTSFMCTPKLLSKTFLTKKLDLDFGQTNGQKCLEFKRLAKRFIALANKKC